jgi:2-polyprenyl-6-methoxyphenol hydroxylase-like FAD-dependent oxidoreductase
MFTKNNLPTITVIGGGIAGAITALRLAERKLAVTIIDKNNELLSGTSNNTPGRMGLGFHYFADFDTAAKYLKSTISFVKKNPGFILGEDKHDCSYLKKGRYFVTNDSLISSNVVLDLASRLQKSYHDLVASDPTNKIFGEPKDFFRILHKKEYENDVNNEKVVLGIETQEHLIDWPKFKQYLHNKIYNNYNITVLAGFNVTHVEKDYLNDCYLVYTNNNVNNIVLGTSCVINCSWENIESINQTVGIYQESGLITSRLKLLAEIELPDSLKEKNSMFFCLGPHAMFSNLGNGTGRVTYAPITNVATSINGTFPLKYKQWLSNGLSPEEEQYYGKKILAGIKEYIPEMSKAKLVKILPGVVKNKGSADIYSINSDFHKRSYSGVEERAHGWIDNACIKLFYCEDNAQEVLSIIGKQQLLAKEDCFKNLLNNFQNKSNSYFKI